MDPLSVTSGVVGIVAFAFQLAKTVSKVRTAVEEMKSAPKEARDLIERLVMLETACELISVHLNRREALSNHALSPSLDLTSKALAQFLAKAQELEQMLSNLTSSNGTTWKLRPKSDIALLSRLRLVLRKDKINVLVQEIDRVISLLQFVIQVDMWTFTSSPQQLSLLSSHDTELTDGSLTTEGTSRVMANKSIPFQCSVPSNARRARNQGRRTFRYLGCITWTTTDGWIGDDDEDGASRIAHRSGSIIFRLPCTSMRIDMHYNYGMGTPSYALNVVHIIEFNSDLGKRIWRLFYSGGDHGELHKMVSKRELSIYSNYRIFGGETNLFFLATSNGWPDGCRYLLQHDFRHEFEENNAAKPRYPKKGLALACASEITEIWLSVRSQDVLEWDIQYLLQIASEPEYFTRYMQRFMKSAGINGPNFLTQFWMILIRQIFNSSNAFSWIPVLQHCIEQGVDIHHPWLARNSQFGSAYTYILWEADHPFTADEKTSSWLKMLKACGVDIASYVETETTLMRKPGSIELIQELDVGRRRREIVFHDFDGLRIPSWQWELPFESHMVEALTEFLNFGDDIHENLLSKNLVYPAGPDDFKVWIHRNPQTPIFDSFVFPFSLSPIDYVVSTDDHRLDGPWCRATYNRAVEIRGERFARRQARKWRKAHPGKGRRSNNIPGAWVD